MDASTYDYYRWTAINQSAEATYDMQLWQWQQGMGPEPWPVGSAEWQDAEDEYYERMERSRRKRGSPHWEGLQGPECEPEDLEFPPGPRPGEKAGGEDQDSSDGDGEKQTKQGPRKRSKRLEWE